MSVFSPMVFPNNLFWHLPSVAENAPLASLPSRLFYPNNVIDTNYEHDNTLYRYALLLL